VVKRTEELRGLQAELEATKAETAGLREVVAGQELSPADVQRMCQERARLEEVGSGCGFSGWMWVCGDVPSMLLCGWVCLCVGVCVS
jgi:hypothetical protein